MERRRALAVAGTVTATLGAAGIAMAVNVGLLGFADSGGPVGKLDAQNVGELVDTTSTTAPVDQAATTTLPPDVQVVYEDIPVPVPAAGGAAPSPAPAGESAPAAPAPAPAASAATTPPPTEPQGAAFDDNGGADQPGVDDHPSGDDHPDDDDNPSDNSGSGSSNSGSGSSNSGSGHGGDDDDD